MLGVVRYPYMPTDVDRYMRQVAIDMGRGETFNKAPVGVYFGSPGVEADDPYFGGVGPRRTYELVPIDGGGYEVHTRHPGWAQRTAHLQRHTYTAEQVIVAAHAYGSAKLLLHCSTKAA